MCSYITHKVDIFGSAKGGAKGYDANRAPDSQEQR